jgi:hypothetical protein
LIPNVIYITGYALSRDRTSQCQRSISLSVRRDPILSAPANQYFRDCALTGHVASMAESTRLTPMQSWQRRSIRVAGLIASGIIDWCKNEGWFGIRVDQGLHVFCKILWLVLILHR